MQLDRRFERPDRLLGATCKLEHFAEIGESVPVRQQEVTCFGEVDGLSYQALPFVEFLPPGEASSIGPSSDRFTNACSKW